MKKLDFNRIIGYFIYRNDRFTEIKLIRDWKILLSFFLISLTVCFGIGAYVFWQYYSKVESGIKVNLNYENKTIIFKKESLTKLMEDLSERKKIFDNTISNPPSIKDPSL
ncbi:MAG: hypothetical protein AB1643_01380 [Patescibacteria group bacterium]